MDEERTTPPEGSQQSVEGSWQDVGKQFQALGESLAQAVRTAWSNEQTQRRVQEMRSGLEAMVQEVGQAIDDSMNSPQGQKIRQGASRTAESVRTATEQTVQDARPHILNALQQLNGELQKLIERMERPASTGGSASTEQEEGSSGDPSI
jgi:hypothetical protein